MAHSRFFAAVMLAATLSFVVTVWPSVTHAAGDCVISADELAVIQTIQSNPNLSYIDEINQELVVRKQLLSKIIACAENDAQSLKSEVDGISVAAADKILQNQLSGKIDDAVNYYAIELAKLNGSGIKGSEQVAAEVLSWRANTYAELASNVDNFVLWSQNQNLFQTASARMAQIAPMVSFLSHVGDNDLANAFAVAQTSFNAAENENTSARNALAQSLSPNQTLTIIKQSLQSLADTYQNFFNVSDIIQKLLAGTSQN